MSQPITNTKQSYICNIEEDAETSRKLSARTFTNFHNQNNSLQSRADVSSQLLNLTGHRNGNYNGRYCPTTIKR